MKKDKMAQFHNRYLFRIIGSLWLCIALFLSAVLLSQAGKEEIDVGMVCAYMGATSLMLAFHAGMRFWRACKTKEPKAYFHLGYVVLYLAAGICAFCGNTTETALYVGAELFLAVFLVKRAHSILRNPTKRNKMLNGMIGLVNLGILLLGTISFAQFERAVALSGALVGVSIMASCIVNIVSMALSSFNVELLRKIVRKTYAGEILFGLLLMVIAFSVAFVQAEPNINSYSDALWYCFAVITTIGFGDFAATSLLGRLLSVILGIYGIVVVAIITSIIVNFYNEVKAAPDAELFDDDADNGDSHADNGGTDPVGNEMCETARVSSSDETAAEPCVEDQTE